MLEINATSIAVVLNFIILVWILNRFLFQPVLKILQDRRDYLESQLASAQKSRTEGENYKSQYQLKLNQAGEESRQIVEQAHGFSEKIKKDAIEAAKIDSAQIRNRALKDAAQTREEIFVKVRSEIGTIAALMAAKILKREIKPADQDKLAEDFYRNLEETHLN